MASVKIILSGAGILTGVGRQAGHISFFLQGKVPFTFTIAMSFSKRPSPDG